MSEQPAQKKESRIWLVWLAIGIIAALAGPTWLYNWQFNPTDDVIFEQTTEPVPQNSPTPESLNENNPTMQ